MKNLLRLFAIILLAALYLAAGVALTLRQVSHKTTKCLDTAFDNVANFIGWDTSCWPLPKANEEPLE